jgi:hypothetical protein
MGAVGVMGARLARTRKLVVGALGFAVTLVLLVPQDQIPEQLRPWVGLLLAVGTLAGIYKVRNDQPAAPTVFARRVEVERGWQPEDPDPRPDPPPRPREQERRAPRRPVE